jgi:hypothetical protein
MTFKDVIDQLKNNIDAAKEKLKEAQDPFNEYSAKPYFHIMAQVLAQRSLDKAEDDLEFFVEFLNEYQIDLKTETDGLDVLILNLDRNKNQL